MSDVVKQARKMAIPTRQDEEKMKRLSDEIMNQVKQEASKYSEVVLVELGGSYAKGTWLKDQMDFDIFVKIRKDVNEKRFEEIGKNVGFKALKKYMPYVRYSEHPYVEARLGKVRVNVVPSYDVEKGQWKSAADRSSFHTKFILETLDKEKKDEVRLLKKFLKGIDIYGAEIAKEGFGGYVAEVLIYNYGSFINVLENVANFTQGQVIGMPTKKFESTLVLIDPIDSNRNLGTAISTQNVGRFMLAARSYLKKPSIKFFTGKKLSARKKNLKNVLVVKFNYKWRSPDIIWGQTKRASTALAGQLELAGFDVLRKSAVTDEGSEAAMLFLLYSTTIEPFLIKNGPDVYRRSDTGNFVTKNSKNILTWVDDNGRILSMQERRQHNAKKFLEILLKKSLSKSGIPTGIIPDIKRSSRVVEGQKVTSKSIKKALSELTSTDELIFGTSK